MRRNARWERVLARAGRPWLTPAHLAARSRLGRPPPPRQRRAHHRSTKAGRASAQSAAEFNSMASDSTHGAESAMVRRSRPTCARPMSACASAQRRRHTMTARLGAASSRHREIDAISAISSTSARATSRRPPDPLLAGRSRQHYSAMRQERRHESDAPAVRLPAAIAAARHPSSTTPALRRERRGRAAE